MIDLAAAARVDRVLAACGGGPTLVVGDASGATLRALRARGVLARAAALETCETDVDLVWLDADGADASELLARALACRPRALVARVRGTREAWERVILRAGWRKHPLYQQVTDYTALDGEADPLLLCERVPLDVTWGAPIDDLAPGRDLHMDMLREAGCRADAHVARYMWARRFVRPGDRVLDAACGLGYGSRVLADGTLAESVMGLDVDETAIRYAQEHYAAGRRRLSYAARDLATLHELPAASVDVIVSFETVEHLADPERFLAGCQRLLTPGGRFLCSVPNQWVNDEGVDPNPHHLHVFDRSRLEALCRRHFLLEHVFGQTAGRGMKLPDAGRALWDASARPDEAEWWLAVGMTPPFGQVADAVDTRWQPAAQDPAPTMVAFARDYEHPWLVRSLVAMGQRTESPAVVDGIVRHALETTPADSADRGAALCVRAYRELATADGLTATTRQAMEDYCGTAPVNPHAARWHISLQYVRGMAALQAGRPDEAAQALAACAGADPLVFSPLLATKTVGACWWLGWLSAQSADLPRAAEWWRAGIQQAERALRRSWDELMGDRDRPVLFGLREAAEVVDLASQCAAGLHLLPHAADRPGILWSQLTCSLTGRLAADARALARLEGLAAAQQAAASAAWARCVQAEGEVARLEAELARVRQEGSPWVLQPTTVDPEFVRVAIFGTGQGGRTALTRLRRRGVSVDCFVDNDPARWHGSIEDVPVVDPSTLPDRRVDFIAVASAPGREAIFAQLTALGYQPGRDFDALT